MKNSKQVNKLVGVDVGGTFTDVFVLNQSSGHVSVSKVASKGYTFIFGKVLLNNFWRRPST